MRRVVLGVLLIGCPAATAAAQDRHEWTEQFGPEGAALGGAILGSVRDPSACYYNPAALQFVKTVGLTASGTAYGYHRLELDDVAGTGRGMTSSDIEATPSLLAGVFHPREGSETTVAFSVLTRSHADLRVNGRGEAIVDIIAGLPGPERFTGVLSQRSVENELWVGVSSASSFLNAHLSVGLSQYLAIRSALTDVVLDATAYNPFSGGNALSRDRMRAEALTLALVWKLSGAFDYAPFRAGLTITPPSLHLWGQGDLTFQQASAGVDLTGDSFADPFDITVADDKAEARWRRSAAVGLGGSFDWEPYRFHLGLEWSAAMGAFAAVRTDQSPSSPAPGGLPYSFRHSQRAVVNVGVAAERRFTEHVRGYVSFRTDFSTGPDGPDSDVTLASWDLYHLTAGAAWKIDAATLALGLAVSLGQGGYDQPVDYGTATEATRLFGGTSHGNVLYLAVRITVGYRYTF